MDMHVDYRFKGHRAARRSRSLLPGEVCHVTAFARDRVPWFVDFHVACEVVRAFRQPRVLGDASLLAWVLMPDHVQWLLEVGEGTPLEKVVARMKSASGVLANRMLARSGPLWEPGYHERALHPIDDARAVGRTIVADPLQAGLVQHIGDYPFWDLAWL